MLVAVLAARDDPPTVVQDELLHRLHHAGVEMLQPALGQPVDGRVEIASEVEELERVTAIYVGGPGLSHAEPLGAEPAPAAAALRRVLYFVERFDKLRRFRLAEKDMRSVERTALALLEGDTGYARIFKRELETALVVIYARPYIHGTMQLPRGWRPKGSDRKLHDLLIDTLRDPYHAHADRTRHRTLIDTTAYLGIDGPPTFAEAWWSLREPELEAIADLARRQAERLEAEANRIGAELGERRDT
jgi:hypothetical protein